jgi:hypothetical protein
MQFDNLRLRNMNKIVLNDVPSRTPQNVVIVGVTLEDLATNIKSVVPVKPFEGKKKDNALKNLQEYLINKVHKSSDVRECIKEDFLQLTKLRKYHKLTL